jgi:hypothetical protein
MVVQKLSLVLLVLLAGLPALLLGCRNPDLFDTDGDGSVDSEDCAPEDPTIHLEAPDPYGDGIDQNCDSCQAPAGDGIDVDCDGYPSNAVLPDDATHLYDCNDQNAAIHPDAEDLPNDGIDQDCFEGDCVDDDGDGFCSGIDDCDDSRDDVYLGAAELPDCVDHDCDGTASEGTAGADDDGDGACEGVDLGYGLQCCEVDEEVGDCDDDSAAANLQDIDGDTWTTCASTPDCDDGDDDRYPFAPELCDGKDNDCDGALPLDGSEDDGDNDGEMICEGDCDDTDDEVNTADDDLDGYSPCAGDCDDEDPVLRPVDGDLDGFSTCTGDCDDHDPLALPGGVEVCDGADNDCDGTLPPDEVDADGDGDPECADCDDADPTQTGNDDDGDGFSTCSVPVPDCDDGNPVINPAATDIVGDGFDQNCDGVDGTDVDGDGAPSMASGGGDCDDNDAVLNLDDADGDGQTSCAGDCDDADPALESLDGDGDGSTSCDGDCDDGDPAINPGAADTAGDGVDDDCDGVDGSDGDSDGYASLASGGDDCDDGDPAINPGAADTAGDGVDDDCDGVDGVDGDGDGFASIASNGEDCDDVDPAIYPHATEIPGDGTDDNCDGLDICEDLNCDGWTDIVFANNFDGASYYQDSWIYWGDETGWSPANRSGIPTIGPGELRIADLDGDGYLDIVFANQRDSDAPINWVLDSYVYWGSPTGYSAADRTDLPTNGGSGIRTADLDDDGYLDIVFGCYWDNSNPLIDSWIYWGSPSGYSTLDRTGIPTLGAWGIDVNDVDDDGSLDILVANWWDGNNWLAPSSHSAGSYIYWGTSGSFSTGDRTTLPSIGPYGIKAWDLDGDGWKDVVITGFWDTADYNQDTFIHWGSSSGFTTSTTLPTPGGTGLDAADLDGDGDLDLLLSSSRTTGPFFSIPSYIYWNDGGSFDPGDRQELETFGAIVNQIADVDLDGTPDLLFANWYDDSTYVRDSFIYFGTSGVYSTADRLDLPTIGGAGVRAVGPGIPIPRTIP